MFRRLTVVLGAVALVLAACGTIRIEPGTVPPAGAAEDDGPVADEDAGGVATNEDTPPTAEAADGVSLTAPGGSVDGVRITGQPAVYDGPPWGVQPEHALVTFDTYPLAGTLHHPGIRIYRVSDLLAMGEPLPSIPTRLQTLLDQQPALESISEPIDLLPIQNAAQLLAAQMAYIRGEHVRGVRMVTHYAQAYIPATNHDTFYTFQGITTDGLYYISAILPVSNPALPPTTPDLTNWLAEPVEETFAAYVEETQAMLNAADPASFTPALADLDAMMTSIRVDGLPDAPPATPATPATATYTSEAYGFAFDYPGEWALSEGPNAVNVTGETMQVTVMYRLAGDAWPGGSGGLPAGELVDTDATSVMGVPMRVQHLMRDGLPRVALYTVADPTAQSSDSLEVFVRADALGDADSWLTPDDLTTLADIVRSFRRTN